MPDPTPTAVAAPPTAQEALEAFGEIENDCSMPMGKTPAGIAAALGVLRAFIEHAAAEADAWAKIREWGLRPRRIATYHASHLEPLVTLETYDAYFNPTSKRFQAKARLAALQLAAAWCAKEGA